jgi:hypothetical protein
MQQLAIAMQQRGLGCLIESYEENNSEDDFLIDRSRRRDRDFGWHCRLRCGVADL